MNRWLFLLDRLGRKLWLRAALYALFGVATAVAAALVRDWVPSEFANRFGGDSVEAILTILASSMLAVATFSLGAMVTAYTAVSQAATPRVAELVTSDESTQKSLSTFIGAFLYAIVGVTAINAHYYGPGGRAVVFVISLGVVGLVAYRLLTWVSRLSSLARLGHMIELVERETRDAMRQRLREPNLGGVEGALPDGVEIDSDETGYVQNIDADHLQRVGEALDCDIEILAQPGKLVRRGEPLARTSVRLDEPGQVRSAFAIGATRSFDQDPRFGLVVLGEIAGKALSPAVNDPGTAVQVIATGLRLMEEWSHGPDEDGAERTRLRVASISEADMLLDVFGSAIRYGAGDVVVAIRLRKALGSLAALGGPVGRAARSLAEEARSRAMASLEATEDRERLKAVKL